MLKYSVNLILNLHKPNDKDQYPIYIRITISRERAYISTGHYIKAQYWDARKELIRNHTDAGTINADITTRKQSIIKKLVEYQVKGEVVTASQIKAVVTRSIDLHNIFEFVERFIGEIKHKRTNGTLKNYRKLLNIIETFHGSRHLAFEEVTHDWLVGFESYLRNPIKEVREGLSGNYVHVLFKDLKAFFNSARKRGIITCYPFSAFENPTYSAPVKDYLTTKELDEVEELLTTATNETTRQTLTYFLLGCYSGLRVSDWRQFDYKKNIQDNRLFIRAKKNGEWVTMPVVGRLATHLERVRDCPLKITEQEMNRTLKNIGIKKKITTHTGRHTFAITMCAEQGISAETCAELMGITVTTCIENYYRVTNRKIDNECLRAWE